MEQEIIILKRRLQRAIELLERLTERGQVIGVTMDKRDVELARQFISDNKERK